MLLTSAEYSNLSSFALKIICFISFKTSSSGFFTEFNVSKILFKTFSLFSSELFVARYIRRGL